MARRSIAYSPEKRRRKDTRKRIARGQNAPIPFPRQMRQEPEDADRFYVVEKILDRRLNTDSGVFEVLVKWENYGPEFDTWEPEEEIKKGCDNLIRNFINGTDEPGPDDKSLYCICKDRYKYRNGGMVQCPNCVNWYHFKCLKMNMEEANSYAKWYCSDCRSKNPDLKCKVKHEKMATFYGQSLAKSLENN